jgi:hypothetical protein
VGVWKSGVGVGVGHGTLLGPEGSVASPHVFGCGGCSCLSVRTLVCCLRVVGLGFRPCVENFTVDASIFVVKTSY